MEPGDSSMAHEGARLVHEWARLAQARHVAEVSQVFLTEIIGQFIASCPVSDFKGHCATSRSQVRERCESATTHRNDYS